MIKYEDLMRAIRISNSKAPKQTHGVVHQLVMSLDLYKERGEYDGSLKSATECLELACYEFEPMKKPEDYSTKAWECKNEDEIICICAVCGSDKISEQGMEDEYLTVCRECSSVEQGYRYIHESEDGYE